MKKISIDNGAHYVTPEEAVAGIDFDIIANMMESEVCERVHNEFAPCTSVEFLTSYLTLANEDLIV